MECEWATLRSLFNRPAKAPFPMARTHVAVVQTGSVLFDTPRTLDRMEGLCQQAAAEGAQLVVFPEAYIGGYPKGLDFGARVGTRTAAGREDYLRYWRAAIDVPGVETARIGGFAAMMNAHLVTGAIEREGATLYCCTLFFGPDGALLGKHRKLMPTASERLVWAPGDGSTLPIVETPAGRVSSAICWENYMPLLRQHLYSRGVDIWCAPTVDEREIWQVSMRHIAYEGRLFVLSACQFLTRDDAPADYDCVQGDAPGTVLIRGGSVIVGPMGDILAGPVHDREVILTADIDTDDIIRARYDLDVAGHYARPDIFTLLTDTTPRATLIDTGDHESD